MLGDAPQSSKLLEPSLLHSNSVAYFCNKCAMLKQRRSPERLILQVRSLDTCRISPVNIVNPEHLSDQYLSVIKL